MLEQPLLYRLTGACRVVLYPVGQTKTITLYLTRQQAEELADVLLPVTDPLWHAPKGGEHPGGDEQRQGKGRQGGAGDRRQQQAERQRDARR